MCIRDRASGGAFGAGHLIDILRGKLTEKVQQHGHQRLSTFGIGSDLGESEWRSLLRQLIARAAVWVDGEHFNTLRLGEGARAVLKGEQSVYLKLQASTRTAPAATARTRSSAASTLPLAARETLAALKAWRAEVARAPSPKRKVLKCAPSTHTAVRAINWRSRLRHSLSPNSAPMPKVLSHAPHRAWRSGRRLAGA